MQACIKSRQFELLIGEGREHERSGPTPMCERDALRVLLESAEELAGADRTGSSHNRALLLIVRRRWPVLCRRFTRAPGKTEHLVSSTRDRHDRSVVVSCSCILKHLGEPILTELLKDARLDVGLEITRGRRWAERAAMDRSERGQVTRRTWLTQRKFELTTTEQRWAEYI